MKNVSIPIVTRSIVFYFLFFCFFDLVAQSNPHEIDLNLPLNNPYLQANGQGPLLVGSSNTKVIPSMRGQFDGFMSIIEKKSATSDNALYGCTFDNSAVANVEVHFDFFPNKLSCESDTVMVSCDGYALAACSTAEKIRIQPVKNDAPLNGVNVVDLLGVKSHLHGNVPFCHPHQYLAADINGSFSVTPNDMLELRNLLLGVTSDRLPTRKSWIFIDKNFTFINPMSPLEEIEFSPPSERPFQVLVPAVHLPYVDFWAIKTGDVNFSANGGNCPSNPLRSTETTVEFEQKNEMNKLSISPMGSVGLTAWQFSFDLSKTGKKVKNVYFPFPSGGINVGWNITTENELRILWFTKDEESTPYYFEGGKPLFEIEFEEEILEENFKLALSDQSVFENIAFNSEMEEASIVFKSASSINRINLDQNESKFELNILPNPSTDVPVFEIHSDEKFEGWLHVTNEMGVKLGSWWIDVKDSSMQIRKSRLSRLPAGQYFVLLETPTGIVYRKWSKI